MNLAMAETVKKSRIVSGTDDNLEESFMEEFNNRLKNCMGQDNQEIANDLYETVDEIKTNGDVTNPSFTFLEKERQNHYDIPRNLNANENSSNTNGFISEPPKTEPPADQYVEMHPPHSLDLIVVGDHYENVDETSHTTNVYEQIERPHDLPTTSLTDFSELPDEPVVKQQTSAKNRMLLSTDDAACLLFTQTVVSPMLTPSDENIDFLKGFKTETEEPDDSSENIYENADVFNQPSESLYENVEMIKNGGIDELVSEETEKCDHIYANVQKIEEITFGGIKGDETDDGTQLVKSLTTQFLKSAEEDEEKVAKWEHSELSELKTLNIMKQICKFESNETTVSTQSFQTSSYVETTTQETNVGEQDKSSLKKKKSKKSRKEHEKENISVTDTNTHNGNSSSYYNVNVKSLCRSFGDLTKVEQCCENGFEKSSRTRSMSDVYNMVVKQKEMENVFERVSVKALKSSFNKFDALQKKNVLHVRSSDSSKAQEKFSGSQIEDASCKSCTKPVFQMEQIKAEKAIWHKNCFRCRECNKQLTVDTYESHEGTLYCKPHFRALFAPKVVEDDARPPKLNRHKLIICENQPLELPPDVVRASDKPDLGLEELQSLNVKERFQVFEHYESEDGHLERTPASAVNVKRSPSILSKLKRFQNKGMDIGVADDSLNGVPIDETSSEEEEEAEEEVEGEDADLIRARRVQKEKPFHFTGMSDVKSKWEQGEQNGREKRREERKQEIQTIRNQLFMGKQGKMKEMYQQAVMESESSSNVKKAVDMESCDTRSIKERFEKGELANEDFKEKDQEDLSVIESGISKKSRSIFLELDANAAKNPPSLGSPTKLSLDVKKTREVFMRQQSEDVVKSSEQVDDVTIKTADIQQRFKFFETYQEPEKTRKQFRITPPREGQVKAPTPEKEVYRDPDVVRAEEYIEDSVVAKQSHTATKMLSKFRQMEEELAKEPTPAGLKPLKRFTPPPEPARRDSSSGEEESGDEEESAASDEGANHKAPDGDLIEAQKAARAKQLRAKFERWEANEIKREQNNSSVNIAEELCDEQSQVESTRSLRARFESMRETSSGGEARAPRVKVHRFVSLGCADFCDGCRLRVYPLERIAVHGRVYHKRCFKCMECGAVLRMDSFSYNQGLVYCLPHFKRLFISNGNYDTGFGFGQHKEKWNATVA